jgi:hypothetical protein
LEQQQKGRRECGISAKMATAVELLSELAGRARRIEQATTPRTPQHEQAAALLVSLNIALREVEDLNHRNLLLQPILLQPVDIEGHFTEVIDAVSQVAKSELVPHESGDVRYSYAVLAAQLATANRAAVLLNA